MTVTDVVTIEGCGSAFELDGFMAVRARTRKANMKRNLPTYCISRRWRRQRSV